MGALSAVIGDDQRAVEVVEVRVRQLAVDSNIDLFGEVLLDLLLGFLDWQFRF